MEILTAEHMGFCYGVRRAVKMARPGRLVTLGPLIHNPQVIARMAAEGVCAVEYLAEAGENDVLIRSHGVGPEIYEEARERGITLRDATCPHVKKAQEQAKAFADRGFQVVVAGEKNHQEVKSILAWAGPGALTAETPEDIGAMKLGDKVGLVSQTTLEREIFEQIKMELAKRTLALEIAPTICTATEQRQEAARQLAKKAAVVVVVGGKNSANTRHLAEVCRKAGAIVYHVETAEELDFRWFSAKDRVGVTAGASTPDWIIEEVRQRMENMDEAMTAEQAGPKGGPEQGSILAGKVVGINKDLVFVDVGQKAEGFITLAELAWPAPLDAHDAVSMGQLLNVLVLEAETAEGSMRQSKVQADRLLAWDHLEEAFNEKKLMDVVVTAAVKGGLSVGIYGIRGFIPASQVDLSFIEDLTPFAGQTLEVLPIEVDRAKQRVVFSRRVILEERRRAGEAAALAKLAVGQVLKGEVKRLASFGAFVDVGGIEGLVHVSEMAWHRVKDPAELLKVGDLAEVQVLKVDAETRKVSLGMKQLQPDPWLTAVADFAEGTSVPGKVTRTSKFGAFIELAPGVEGLAHISELADKRVATAEEVVHVGQKLPVKVLSIDPSSKRISLSVVKAQEDAERKDFEQYLTAPTSLSATIGDKLGHLFKNREQE